MILFTDEDVGATIPRFLRSLGLDNRCLIEEIPSGTHDVDWLAAAGGNGWLVFSCNKRMLSIPRERQAIVQGNVGIVFLTSGQEKRLVLTRLLLNKWRWLEHFDTAVPRPFAFLLQPNGRSRQVLLP